MDDKKNDIAQDEYIHEVEESAVSNPFSNAFKTILQKLHLIKNDQKLIGDSETNSRGYQTTRLDPLKATEKRSLRTILRTTFENIQNRRFQKLQEKNAVNTMPKYTVSQTMSEPTSEKALSDKDIVKPIIPTRVSSTNARTSPTLETMHVDESTVEKIDKVETVEGFSGSDTSSSEGTLSAVEIVTEASQSQVAKNVIVMAETLVTDESELGDDGKAKSTGKKGSKATDERDMQL